MQYEVEVNGRTRLVALTRSKDGFTITLDGRTFEVDTARVDAQTLSLIVSRGIAPGEVRRPAFAEASAVKKPDATYEGNVVTAQDVHATPAVRRTYEITITPDPVSGQLTVRVGTTPLLVALNGVRRRSSRGAETGHAGGGPQRIIAPMPGRIARVLVRSGEAVHARQPIVVVEAMKMENELRAGRAGTIAEVHAREGQSVDAGALLIVIA